MRKCTGGSYPGCLPLLGYLRPTALRADDAGAGLKAELGRFFLRRGFVRSVDAGLAVSTSVSLCKVFQN